MYNLAFLKSFKNEFVYTDVLVYLINIYKCITNIHKFILTSDISKPTELSNELDI